MVLPMLLIGIGNAIPWGLIGALSVGVVPKERAGMAAGIFTTMRVAGKAIAIVAIGAALIGLTTRNIADSARAGGTALPGKAAALVDGIGSGNEGSNAPLTALLHESYADGFRTVLIVLAILTVITAVVCFLTLRTPTDPTAQGD